MQKSKSAVGDQIKVEELGARPRAGSQVEEDDPGDEVESNFDLNSRPAFPVVHWNPLTTSMAKATQSPDRNGERDNQREAISGWLLIAHQTFPKFDPKVSSQEGTGDGLTVEPRDPSIGSGVEKALGDEIGKLGSDEGPGKRSQIDGKHSRVSFGSPDPIKKTEGDPQKCEKTIG